ncbi:hypothetical protein [Bradyrhizobium macuxiense]|uniref:hypothetical protein n=1 Tax=Bradyrhizobium macuxiense TaxID=1755647 RepID=UPI001FD9FAF5|nr:hypothetical protein [Bradyrhizobium macuxiense]
MTGMIDDLKDQADRAERLARTGLDPLTAERLRAYADECRNRIASAEREHDGRVTSSSVPAPLSPRS